MRAHRVKAFPLTGGGSSPGVKRRGRAKRRPNDGRDAAKTMDETMKKRRKRW
jgi:hypothetical protein